MDRVKVRRFFAGIRVSDEIIRKCLIRQKNPDPSARLVRAEDMHITLVPPLSIADVSALKNRIAMVANKTRAFDLRTDHITYGPTYTNPNMLWLKLLPSEDLTRLKRSLLVCLGKKESREFIPHVTIARFDLDHLVERSEFERMKYAVDLTMRVRHIDLYESPGGGQYNIIESIPFLSQ